MIQTVFSFKNGLLHHKNKLIWLIFTIIGVSTLLEPAIFFGPDLDASGTVALVWFHVKNLQIGQDIVSQFGPLSYLFVPFYVEHFTWVQTMLYTTFIHFFFIFSIALLVIKLRSKWKDNLAVFLLVASLSYLGTTVGKIDEQTTFSIIIFLYLIITGKIGKKYEVTLLASLALLLAIESLIEFNIAVANASIVIIFSLISLFKKEFKNPLILSVSYIFSLVILWVMSGQNISDFSSYFTDGLKISSGYNIAQAIDGPMYQVFAALIAISFLTILFVYSSFKKYKNLIIFMLLNSTLLFISFKHGFVRQDGHVLYFFFTYGMFFICTYIIYKYDSPQATRSIIRLVLLLVLLSGSVLFVANMDLTNPQLIILNEIKNVGDNVRPWGEVIPLIFDKSYQTQKAEGHLESLRSHLPIDEKTIQYIGNKTMDIFPYDIMIPWLYNFNWDPRPMPWSFQVFNTYLDELNAKHFLKENETPQVILYSYKSVDWRYPLFDEPLTMAAILKNYQYVQTSNGYALLSYSPDHNNWKTEEDLGTVESVIGKPIAIPKYNKGYVFAHIDLKFSPLGNVMNILYKPALTHIMFKFSDDTYSQDFRLIPGTSNDGVFVSQYVGAINDFSSILSDNLTQNIDDMIVMVDDPEQFEKNVKVKFVGVPTQIHIQKNNENKISDWSSLRVTQGGLMTIDWIDNMLYAKQPNIINIGTDMGNFIPISGWAVDNLAKDGTVKTYLVFQDNEGNKITLPTRKEQRPDLVSALGADSYLNGGWATAINTSNFEHKCYTLSLWVPRSNGHEYFEINTSKSICFG